MRGRQVRTNYEGINHPRWCLPTCTCICVSVYTYACILSSMTMWTHKHNCHVERREVDNDLHSASERPCQLLVHRRDDFAHSLTRKKTESSQTLGLLILNPQDPQPCPAPEQRPGCSLPSTLPPSTCIASPTPKLPMLRVQALPIGNGSG